MGSIQKITLIWITSISMNQLPNLNDAQSHIFRQIPVLSANVVKYAELAFVFKLDDHVCFLILHIHIAFLEHKVYRRSRL